jgi:hypothetical protein
MAFYACYSSQPSQQAKGSKEESYFSFFVGD